MCRCHSCGVQGVWYHSHDMSDDQGAPGPSAAGAEGGGLSFPAFVLSLAHTDAVHFGDVPDPKTGTKGMPNLPAAQQMIDILALLELKTRGNLTAEERQLIEQLLVELHERFTDAQQGGPRIIQP